jgi:predicted nucleotidyltransferase
MSTVDPVLLRQAVLATLVYHDFLEMPLTATEVCRYLFRPKEEKLEVSVFSEVEQSLDDLVKEKTLIFSLGYYTFPSRENLINQRIRSHAVAQTKWRRLRRIAWFLQAVPFLEMVAASGSMARELVKEDSDLDVLLVTRSGRIWMVRFIVTVALDALGLRRRPTGPTKNLICLNHYLAQDALKLPYQSLYTALEYARIIPLFGEKQCWKFRIENKEWIEKYLVSVLLDNTRHIKTVKSFFILNIIKRAGEVALSGFAGDLLEKWLGDKQKKRITRGIETSETGGRVIASAMHLEFHPHSKEAPLLKVFNEKMAQMGLVKFGDQKDSGLS